MVARTNRNDLTRNCKEEMQMNFCNLCSRNECFKCNRKGIGEHQHVCYGCMTGSAEIYK
jgi:hypothetical protein